MKDDWYFDCTASGGLFYWEEVWDERGAAMSDEMEALVAAEVDKRLVDPAYLQGQLLRLIGDRERLAETVRARERELEALAPAKAFYDAVTESDDWMDMAAAVKTLAIPGYGRNKAFALLRARRVIRYNGEGGNEPYQEYVDRGYFKIVEKPYEDADGLPQVYRKTAVSNKGLEFIRKVIIAEGKQ